MIVAFLDWIGPHQLGGWAANMANLDHDVVVRIYQGDAVLVECRCDQIREDLPTVRGGRCGFALSLPPCMLVQQLWTIAFNDRALDIFAESGTQRTRVQVSEDARRIILETNAEKLTNSLAYLTKQFCVLMVAFICITALTNSQHTFIRAKPLMQV
ncbi:hypothetical protein ACFQU2_06735 [Siccirubricoccus deserti]